MSVFEVTLTHGKVIHVNAGSEADALAHAKAVADQHHKAIHVGPESVGVGPALRLHRAPNPQRAFDEQPVSATQVK